MSAMTSPQIITCVTQDFTTHAVSSLKEIILDAQSKRGICVLGLSGGSTPKPVYAALAKEPGIDWSKVWIFLVDDRYIRADDPKSNQFLLRSTLLSSAPIPESQILFPDVTLPLEECVQKYSEHVSALTKKKGIDAIMLGMGDDGHTASLFPPVVSSGLSGLGAIHTTTKVFDVFDRISCTLPLLLSAKHAFVYLSGAKKKEVWEEMTASSEDTTRWPLKGIITAVPTTVFQVL